MINGILTDQAIISLIFGVMSSAFDTLRLVVRSPR